MLGQLFIQRQNDADGLRREVLHLGEIEQELVSFLLIDQLVDGLADALQFHGVHEGIGDELDDRKAAVLALGKEGFHASLFSFSSDGTDGSRSLLPLAAQDTWGGL